jgi:PE family
VAIALGEVHPNAQLQVLFEISGGWVLGKGLKMFVTTDTDVLQGAAGTLSGIGDAMVARNSAAATPTTSLAPAASDLVSAMTAVQFGQHGATYQQIAAQAAEVHEQLVAALRSGAGAYALAEAANVAAGSIGL